MASLAERRHELVGMLIFRRAAFHAEYRRVMALSADDDIRLIYDRNMLVAILEKEFPGEDIWPPRAEEPRLESEGSR